MNRGHSRANSTGCMTENEKNLLAGCIRGDNGSWDAFVLQYSDLVYHTIRKTLVTYHAELNWVFIYAGTPVWWRACGKWRTALLPS